MPEISGTDASKKQIHLSAAHVAGVDNCEADEESRTVNDDTEWAILP